MNDFALFHKASFLQIASVIGPLGIVEIQTAILPFRIYIFASWFCACLLISHVLFLDCTKLYPKTGFTHTHHTPPHPTSLSNLF
jgi:hypothetical protein